MTDTPETKPFEPVIIGFTCNWCSYRAADMAGTARMKYAPNVRLIRLMCSGRLDPDLRLQGLRRRRGCRADLRLPSGRLPLHRPELQGPAPLPSCCRRTLAQMGIEPGRLKLLWASAAEGVSLCRGDHQIR